MGMAKAIRLQYLKSFELGLDKSYVYDPETEYKEIVRGFFDSNLENTPENKLE